MQVFRPAVRVALGGFGMALLIAACGGGGGDAGDGGNGNLAKPVASVTVTPTQAQDYWGYTTQLIAGATDADGAAVSPAPAFTWSSSDPSIASVDASGLVTLVRPGAAAITVSAEGKTATAQVGIKGLDRLARGMDSTMCALDDAHVRIFCWGRSGTTTSPIVTPATADFKHVQPTPIPQGAIPAGATIAKVAMPLFAACALTDAGAVYCWGQNDHGVLGLGDTTTQTSTPRGILQGAVPAGVRLVDIAASAWTACALGDDGKAYCWGANTAIPNPVLSSTGNSPTPVATVAGDVPAGVKLVRIALSTNVGCALGDDGHAYCWKVGAITPRRVALGERPAGSGYTEIQIGSDLPCALAQDGEAYCWGTGFGRRFGAGSAAFVSNADPTRVARGARPAGVMLTAISVGGVATASCAAGDNGKAYCWAMGYRGSLGDGDLADHEALVPTEVLDGEKGGGFAWRGVNCGTYTCTATASDGRAYNWGANEDVLLSRDNPPLTGSATPLLVTRVIRP